jgi:hypothetical protein
MFNHYLKTLFSIFQFDIATEVVFCGAAIVISNKYGRGLHFSNFQVSSLRNLKTEFTEPSIVLFKFLSFVVLFSTSCALISINKKNCRSKKKIMSLVTFNSKTMFLDFSTHTIFFLKRRQEKEICTFIQQD